MVNYQANDLNYGHLGQAIYDTDTGRWAFGRIPGRKHTLRQLGPWKSMLESPIKFEDSPVPDDPRTYRKAEQETKSLIKEHPQLCPASGLLPDAAITSTAVSSILDTYDPLIGDLISFGHVAHERGRHRDVTAAVPTGENGNVLRLVRASTVRYGWEPFKNPYIEALSLDEESGWWVGDATPIQQLCFSQSEDRFNFLAVRCLTKTEIFHPIYHDTAHPSNASPYFKLPASKLNPRPILTISAANTGGLSHVDVTFNPDYQRQIGIIDQKGGWSVWDIDGGYRKSKYTISCTNRGSLSVKDEEVSHETPELREDGWGRILWVGDVNTILVSNRRKLQLYDIRGEIGIFTILHSPEFVSPSTPDWILDVRKSLKKKDRFYVLTSTCLHIAEVRTSVDTEINQGKEAGASIVLSWRHFRGGEDTTLQMCIPTDNEDESVILIYSRLNGLTTVYRFTDGEEEPGLPFSLSDPIELKLDGESFCNLGLHIRPATFNLRSVEYGEDIQHKTGGQGVKYMENGVEFYILTVIRSDMSVYEAVLYSMERRNDAVENNQVMLHIEAPDWEKKIRRREVRSKNDLNGNDYFVVADGMETGKHPNPKLLRWPLAATSQSKSCIVYHFEVKKKKDPWTIDNTLMYNSLVSLGNEQEDVLSILGSVTDKLNEDPISSDNPLETLFDFPQSRLAISNVDEASSKLSQLFHIHSYDPDREAAAFELQRIATPALLKLAGEDPEEPTISSIYDFILQNWVAPLSLHVSGPVRQTKERLSRQIAAEVMLASSRIRISEPKKRIQQATQNEASESQNTIRSDWFAMPPVSSRRETEGDDSNIPSSLAPSSMLPPSSVPIMPSSPPQYIRTAFPTPEATPSLVSGTTFTSSFSTSEANPVANLGKYLTILKPPHTTPPSVSQVLMHWRVGEDPNAYDWNATTRAVHEQLHVDDEMSASRRRKLQRKAVRHLKRQRRETAAMLAKTESQPILVHGYGLRSSPGPALGGSSSQAPGQSQSQAAGFSQGIRVASQVERGPHGGRAVKKKKKSRVSGF